MTATSIFRSVILVTTLTIHTSIFAGQPNQYDMGEANTQSLPVNEGPVTLRVINKLSAEKYFLEEIRIENTAVDSLVPIGKVAGPFGDDEKIQPKGIKSQEVCASLKKIVGQIKGAESEQDLSKYRNNWNTKKLELKKDTGCNDVVAEGDAQLSKSEKEYGPYSLKKGQRLVLTIKRKSEDSKEVTWTFIASTQPRGQWVGSWGIAFVPNKDRDYYAKPNGAGAYTVIEKQDNDSVNLIPAVFYTWLSKVEEADTWVCSPVGGLGLDKSNLTLFLGGNVTYNRNLSVSLGAVVHQQHRLKGEFTPGQTINDASTSSALTELVYKVNWFVSMGLRF